MLYIYQSLEDIEAKYFVNFITNPQDFLIFHTITTGHYWRNSMITELQLLSLDENEMPFIEIWKCEKEEDEYEILTILSKKISKIRNIIGYNSLSFHIPYLKKKYGAYGLEYPFTIHHHIDLLKELKQISSMLNISLKLENLELYFHLSEEEPEIKTILASMQLLVYQEFFMGNFSVKETDYDSDHISVSLNSSLALSKSLHFHHPAFYLILDDETIKINIRLFDGKIRVYYSNYKDYYLLPDEGILIHKSMSGGIAKSRLIKATAQNCYQQIPLPSSFTNEYIEKYLKMLLRNIFEMNR